MKKTLLTLMVSALAVFTQAQMPQTFGYQVAVRDANGTLLKNQQIGVRVSLFCIPQADTLIYYKETHQAKTDNFGVATINIMGGSVVEDHLANSGGFGQIISNSAKPFMLIEIDPAGGTNYTMKSSAQLLPVPYATHAEEAKQAAKVNSSLGDMPLVDVKVKVTGDVTSNGYVDFLGKTIAVGSEETFRVPAYSPVYISKIAKSNSSYRFSRSVKLNNTTVNISKGQSIYSSESSEPIRVPVKSAKNDYNVFVVENGSATTIEGEQMKPLYGIIKNQNDNQFNDAYNNSKSVLYVQFSNYNHTIIDNKYSYDEDIPNVLVGPFNERENTIEIEYTKIIY